MHAVHLVSHHVTLIVHAVFQRHIDAIVPRQAGGTGMPGFKRAQHLNHKINSLARPHANVADVTSAREEIVAVLVEGNSHHTV